MIALIAVIGCLALILLSFGAQITRHLETIKRLRSLVEEAADTFERMESPSVSLHFRKRLERIK